MRYGYDNDVEYDALRAQMGLASEGPSNDDDEYDDEKEEEEEEKWACPGPPAALSTRMIERMSNERTTGRGVGGNILGLSLRVIVCRIIVW
jgi:hypothetical protein